MVNVFILGSRGYTKKYGGWEALIHGLVENQSNNKIKYHIYEAVNDPGEAGILSIDNITCIKLYANENGGSGSAMVMFDAKASFHAIKYIKNSHIENPIMLYLGLRIGVLVYFLRPYIKSLGIVVMENPAGLEWERPKWGKFAQLYMRISAYFMARASDYLVCDAEGIRDVYSKMIPFKRPKKEYIAYGAYPAKNLSPTFPEKVQLYFDKFQIVPGEYYVIVNRFMPENSYELILSEFVKSDTQKDLVLVTNIDKEFRYYENLSQKIPFKKDKRIKFVGTMYDTEILNYLRQNAFAYINGHTLGGTNPGLLEAMASTGVVLAYDVIFSREVCGDFALFYDTVHTLRDAMKECELMDIDQRKELIQAARNRMAEKYNWMNISRSYETLFENAILSMKNKERGLTHV